MWYQDIQLWKNQFCLSGNRDMGEDEKNNVNTDVEEKSSNPQPIPQDPRNTHNHPPAGSGILVLTVFRRQDEIRTISTELVKPHASSKLWQFKLNCTKQLSLWCHSCFLRKKNCCPPPVNPRRCSWNSENGQHAKISFYASCFSCPVMPTCAMLVVVSKPIISCEYIHHLLKY